ncbi:hypothetical protein F4604DRAFT_1673787 [Suillus subluteus]|nr:hypothetical protein F4604DRAFT_1673787 [Suillus subluteus]
MSDKLIEWQHEPVTWGDQVDHRHTDRILEHRKFEKHVFGLPIQNPESEIINNVNLVQSLGNMLFLSGLTLIIGPQKTFYFFARKQKLRGTACFIGGILLVFMKYSFIGMIVEIFGFLNLFGQVQRLLPRGRDIPAPSAIHWQPIVAAIHSTYRGSYSGFKDVGCVTPQTGSPNIRYSELQRHFTNNRLDALYSSSIMADIPHFSCDRNQFVTGYSPTVRTSFSVIGKRIG